MILADIRARTDQMKQKLLIKTWIAIILHFCIFFGKPEAVVLSSISPKGTRSFNHDI